MQAGLIAILLREHRRRQSAEVQSRQRMAELAHVNRFSTAGELTASIAHEINQPLGSILTNAETAQAILKSQSPDIAERPEIIELKDIVNDILQDDRRATEVIRRMRSLLKKAPFELKNLDLNDLARETVEFLSTLAIGREVELVSVITPNALPILGDRIQLQQVILNLVLNGIDAMRDTPSANRIINIRTSRVENFAQLSVSDRGSGIPEEKLKEVFEPFFTSKAEGMGWGCPSRAPSLRPIVGRYRQKIGITAARRSGSGFHLSNSGRCARCRRRRPCCLADGHACHRAAVGPVQVAPPARHPAAGAAGISQPISNHRCIDKARLVAWPCRAVLSNS